MIHLIDDHLDGYDAYKDLPEIMKMICKTRTIEEEHTLKIEMHKTLTEIDTLEWVLTPMKETQDDPTQTKNNL